MAKRQALSFSQEDLRILAQERYEHPDPRVQKRMEVLWLVSQEVTHREAAKLAGVSRPTAERYVATYRKGGVAALRHFDWKKPVSELEQASGQPGRIVSQASAAHCGRGLRPHQGGNRSGTPAHAGARFFKKLGLKWRCVAAMPVPPKKTVAEHAATQAEFLEQKLEPALAEARAGKAHLFFVDAAHFVMGSFLCCV